MTQFAVPVAAHRSAHRAGSTGYRRATGALCGAGLASFAAMYCTQALLSDLSAYYRVAPAAAALTISVTTGMLALCIIPASVLSERFGRTPVMLASGVASSVIGLLLPFSPTLAVLLAGRALHGMALAGIPAVAMAYLAEEVHASALGAAMGRYIAGTTVGGLIGRFVPALIVDISSWRVALLVGSFATVAGTVAFAVLVPKSRFFVPKPVSVRTTIRSLVAHLRNPLLVKLFGLAFVLMGSFVTVYNYLGYRLTAQPFGLASSVVGLLFLLYLVGTVTSTFAGRLGGRRILALAVAVPIAAAGLLATIAPALVPIVLGLGVFTGAFFAAHTVASSWVGAVAHRDRAEASALYLCSYYLGGSLAGAVGGLAFSLGGWPATAAFVSLLLLAGLLLVTLLARETGNRAPGLVTAG